jgi:NADH:ubiquinone reductase (H+-translocating)
MSTGIQHVVIVGGGFGGLAAAKALKHAPVRVTLIDSANHHLFQPLLYQVATSVHTLGNIASPMLGILRNQEDVTVLLGMSGNFRHEKRTFGKPCLKNEILRR